MRREDWTSRLHGYIEATRHQPYDPVKHNCALFAAGAVKAVLGADPQAELGLNPKSLREVLEVLNAHGGVKGLATKYLGHEMRAPLMARRGDVVVRPGTDGDTLGICMGDHALFLTVDGLQPRPLKECDGCWGVG